MNDIRENELEFVSRHYRKGRLNTNKAWRSFRNRTGHTSFITLHRKAIAASAALVLGLSVALAFNWNTIFPPTPAHPLIEVRNGATILKYNNEPIGNVLQELSDFYGNDITTADPSRRISGEIESSSLEETIEILEATLDIKIEVR